MPSATPTDAYTITEFCHDCGDYFDQAVMSTVDIAEDGARRSYDVELCPGCYEDRMGEAPDLD